MDSQENNKKKTEQKNWREKNVKDGGQTGKHVTVSEAPVRGGISRFFH